MIDYVPTLSTTLNPRWSKRNERISKFIKDDSSILDLGCGSKDLLRYTSPKDYTGIDYKQPLADYEINFNTDFELPKGSWNYIVASGLLEYLFDIDNFFSKVKNKSDSYIFTFWRDAHLAESIKNPKLHSVDQVVNIINNNFSVIKTDEFKKHIIFICKDKS
jgi:SAM-dependent methyltransferase